jgi:hypothetical protein
MIKLDIKTDNLKEIQSQLEGIDKRHWPKILSGATTETAFYVRNKLRKEMPSHIDRPKPYTLNSIFVDKGRPREKDVEATVLWKNSMGNSGGKYLKPLVEGGDRHAKGFEKLMIAKGFMKAGMKAVPSDDAPKDAFGNVPGSFIVKVLSWLRVLRDPLQNRAIGDKAKKITAKTMEFFVVTDQKGALSPGIYQRKRFASFSAVRRIFAFVRTTSYKKSFPFYDIGRKAAAEKFPEKLDEALTRHFESYRKR